MRQTLAIFLDAYRELNSRRLFWIVMGLTVVVVAAFSIVGVNERGTTILGWSFPSPFNSFTTPPSLFYKLMFENLGVKFWLGWISTILALIATGGMFPDLVSNGSIELTLSKPIGRVRLFLTKYLAGLTFTALQVTLFTFCAFLVLGFRGKDWEPGLFWTVPIMVVFYSYLFCMCVLIGIVTRSSVAALLITLLLWFVVIFGMHTTERTLMLFVERNAAQAEKLQQRISIGEAAVALAENSPEKEKPSIAKFLQQDPKKKLDSMRKTLKDIQDEGVTIRRWHLGVYAVKTVMPKTSETIDLLERVLVSQADMKQLRGDDAETIDFGDEPEDRRVNMKKVAERIQDKLRARPVWWVMGTSLAFEFLVLGIAGWIFVRRDF